MIELNASCINGRTPAIAWAARRLSLSALVAFAVHGCNDPLGENADERRRERKALEERREEGAQRDSLAEAMKAVVSEKRKFLEASIKEQGSEVAVLRADLERFSAAVSEAIDAKSDSGQESKYGLKVFNAMKSEVVNGLAVKYLGSDFSMVREEFLARLRDVRAEDLRYRKALEEADAAHERETDSSQDWIAATRSQRDAEIARLKKEIEALESQQAKARTDVKTLTRHSLVGSARHERERFEKGIETGDRIIDIRNQLDKKRWQLDYLLSPDRTINSANNAARRAQDIRWTADRRHESRLHDIRRELKPGKTVSDVVGEYEAKTVGRLRTAIASRLEAAEKALSDNKGKVMSIRNMEMSIPILSLSDLKSLREKLIAL